VDRGGRRADPAGAAPAPGPLFPSFLVGIIRGSLQGQYLAAGRTPNEARCAALSVTRTWGERLAAAPDAEPPQEYFESLLPALDGCPV
jgi:hypothetical protein